MDISDLVSEMYQILSFCYAGLHLSESKLSPLIVGHDIYVVKTKLVN